MLFNFTLVSLRAKTPIDQLRQHPEAPWPQAMRGDKRLRPHRNYTIFTPKNYTSFCAL